MEENGIRNSNEKVFVCVTRIAAAEKLCGGRSLLKKFEKSFSGRSAANDKTFTVIIIVNSVGKAEAPHCVPRWRLHKSPMTASMMN